MKLFSLSLIFIIGSTALSMQIRASDNLVLNKISPIQMNRGRAVSVQLEAPVQMVVIMASPAGLEVNNSIPTQATPIKERPTQTELPKRKNSVKINITVA